MSRPSSYAATGPTPSQSLAKLTSISTKTLSLLLERQRSSSLSTSTSSSNNVLHLDQIQANLAALRSGILELESNGSSTAQTEAVKLLRKQYERMRSMLLADGENIHVPLALTLPSNASLTPMVSTPPPRSNSSSPDYRDDAEPPYSSAPLTPYTDEPSTGQAHDRENLEPSILLQEQQQLINTQDTHLLALHDSISRHHNLSLQINSELDTHHGLLEELDTELDQTESRLGNARRRLERVSRGLKGNGSAVCIGVLILVLLILIIAFKT
ncbi:hypothetical protein BDP27DRAFT_1322684 [Rhodocollybia butyracea]|uniref:t-SNARE coiled-coil homology domain-containing protein n=1 Tax=Rhodocollybia butyracea TaxID=206335 RepID=A0A9P5U9I1_9AGAR|nr:hypothetical protein BDP27DRAFT_1322684 [Rhodocollybia butyracea]